MHTPAELTHLNESIRIFPDVTDDLTDKTLVVGDLHGNAMKLFYILLRYGVLSLDRPDLFKDAWEIYDKPTDELSIDDSNTFEQIINNTGVQLPGLLNLIGDEFADRGKNDFFTALIFKKLHDSHVPFRIQPSNHGSYLISYLETEAQVLPPLKSGQTASLDNYIALEKRIPSIHDQFKQLTEHAYKDHVSLIGYAQPEGAPLCLFTHAPIDGTTLHNLAIQFEVPYNDTSVEGLIASIDQINLKFHALIESNQLSARILQNSTFKGTDPVYETLWNRNWCRKPLPLNASNVHGHVGDFEKVAEFSDRHINLDSDWGKPDEHVYNQAGKFQGTIPADDKKNSPMFRTQVSPADRLSVYYREAAMMESPEVVASRKV